MNRASDGVSADGLSVVERLGLVARAFRSAPADEDTPTLLLSQCVAAAGADGGVICYRRGDELVVVASQGYTAAQRASCGELHIGDMTLPLTCAATTAVPVWLQSQAEVVERFPRIVVLVARGERAYAAVPILLGGYVVGVLGLSYLASHRFTEAERSFILALAGMCGEHLRLSTEQVVRDVTESQAAILGRLVQAMSQTESVNEVATVISEEGALAAGAEFANVAIPVEGSEGRTAQIVHSGSLATDIAERYSLIPIDGTSPLGVALQSGQEVWLPTLDDVAVRYPGLVADTTAAGLTASASLPLFDRFQHPLGALGLAWAAPQEFTTQRQDTIRVIARLAADALDRAGQLERERRRREDAERLREILTALVGAETLAQVSRAVFDYGIAPLGAAAARLALTEGSNSQRLSTFDSVGIDPSLLAAWEALPPGCSPSSDALATSRTVYVASAEELAARYPRSYPVLTASGHQAWLSLPLVMRNKVIGVLTLAYSEAQPIVVTQDQIAVSALATAVGEAISRASAHDQDRALVLDVQNSILSAPLPRQPGVRLGATYLAAETRFDIGGDWYDAVGLNDGRVLLMIGDLAGHGVRAAITMSHLRSAARALAPAHPPGQLLDELDQFASSLTEHSISTAACVIIDPAHRTLHYSVAGHPPPLLRTPGRHVLDLDRGSGILLGVGAQGRTQHSQSYEPGSALLLYTDGLIERRGEDLDVGLQRARTALAAISPQDLDETIASLITAIGNPQPEDDVAVLLAMLD